MEGDGPRGRAEGQERAQRDSKKPKRETDRTGRATVTPRCEPTALTPTVTSATPQSRSSGSRRCARLTRSWTPVRIFTVNGTSSTFEDRGGTGGYLAESWGPEERQSAQEPGYLIHAPHDLLELSSTIHERTAATLWTETLVSSREADTPYRHPRRAEPTRCAPYPDGETEARGQQGRALGLAPGQNGHHLLVDEVDGAAHVDVHEVHFDGAVEELSTFGHGVRERALQLHRAERGQ